MEYRPITCNSLVKKITKTDPLFKGMYCVDPYQNCEFGCLYCDSSFGKTIYVKTNANAILNKEIENLEKGVIVIGSVHDPYQKSEGKYEITKNLLKTIKKYHFPCHILTKSTLVLRDINLLTDMQCLVTISIVSLDANISHVFEKNVPSPKERLQTVKILTEHGIKTGVALIPVLPFLVESELEDIVHMASSFNAQYLLHKYLELKGEQKKAFRNVIQNHYLHLLSNLDELYKDDFKPGENYVATLDQRMYRLCKKYKIPGKIVL
ncbi:MAG: radical SAM protein [Thermoplasmatales archaeon]|nr:MAG: radical SAM protein [Thermoplasmatales archaeon]